MLTFDLITQFCRIPPINQIKCSTAEMSVLLYYYTYRMTRVWECEWDAMLSIFECCCYAYTFVSNIYQRRDSRWTRCGGTNKSRWRMKKIRKYTERRRRRRKKMGRLVCVGCKWSNTDDCFGPLNPEMFSFFISFFLPPLPLSVHGILSLMNISEQFQIFDTQHLASAQS